MHRLRVLNLKWSTFGLMVDSSLLDTWRVGTLSMGSTLFFLWGLLRASHVLGGLLRLYSIGESQEREDTWKLYQEGWETRKRCMEIVHHGDMFHPSMKVPMRELSLARRHFLYRCINLSLQDSFSKKRRLIPPSINWLMTS